MDYDLSLIRQRVNDKYKKMLGLIDSLEANESKELETLLGAELASSIQASSDLHELQNEWPYFNYDEYYDTAACYFMYNKVRFNLMELHDLHAPNGAPDNYDICIMMVEAYSPSDNDYKWNLVPDVYCYGSSSDDFDKFKPVPKILVDAADKWIKEHPGYVQKCVN